MAIKQERMIALIEAALAFKRSREALAENINHWAGQAITGEIAPLDALQRIMQAALLTPEGQFYEVLGAERAHFDRVASKNIRDQTRRLAAQGKIPDPYVRRGNKAQIIAQVQAQARAAEQARVQAQAQADIVPDLSEATPWEEGEEFFDLGITPAEAPAKAPPSIPEPTQAELQADAELAAQLFAEPAPAEPSSGWTPAQAAKAVP